MSRNQFLTATSPETEVRIRNAGGNFETIPVWIKEEHFYPVPPKAPKGAKKKNRPDTEGPDKDACLVIGFDTEYVQAGDDLSREELKEGKGKNRPVSYQVYCRLVDAKSEQNGVEWGGVFYPRCVDSRFTLDEVISFAVCRGVELGHVEKVPRQIELISHFSRADMPMLENLEQMRPFLDAVRGVFVTMQPLTLRYALEAGALDLKVSIRDTYLLTAEGAKRLEDLGDVVGVPKVKLADTPEEEKVIKSRMDLLLESDPDLFEQYALADAVICVRYHERIRDLCRETIGSAKVPLTLSGIGVKRLQRMWERDKAIEPFQVLGLEKYEERAFDRDTGRMYRQTKVVDRELVHLRRTLAIEAYHGGRGEQYWFGPGPVEAQPATWIKRFSGPASMPAPVPMVWNDFDLSSAYPTAMSLIGYPDWDRMNLHPALEDFAPTTLGVALVDFEFPEAVRYPCLPVRTDRGLVFPRRGRSYCSAPEIALAVGLGATIKVIDGAVVPILTDAIRPFGQFVSNAIKERKSHRKGSLENRFWKEMVNALYGKLAQGLRQKRVFNVSDLTTQDLGPSLITNPYFAAFVTGYVRALLAEIMNALPNHVLIFSCTTDGFLSTATRDEIDTACEGVMASAYRKARFDVAGSDEIIELKHQTGQLLGWRTRGQATIQPGVPQPDDPGREFVLAKAGIRTPEEAQTLQEQNAYIVDLFLTRTPTTRVEIKSFTGIRDIILDKNDLVPKTINRRLGMEYDFKRRPAALGSAVVGNHRHVTWSTTPWETVEQFNAVRDELDIYRTPKPKMGEQETGLGERDRGCIMMGNDFINFATRIAVKSSEGDSGYIQAENPDIKILRRVLCAARHHKQAGLDKDTDGLTAAEFAAKLTAAGIPCKRSDVENGSRLKSSKAFTLNAVTATGPVREALAKLQTAMPSLRSQDILTESALDLLANLRWVGCDGREIPLRLWKYPVVH